MEYIVVRNNELYHHGIKGQEWGKRRFQYKDGSVTPAGAERYYVNPSSGDKERARRLRYSGHNPSIASRTSSSSKSEEKTEEAKTEESKTEETEPNTEKKSIEELANEVIQGKYSVGEERKKMLSDLGYDYDAVQSRVNELMSSYSTPVSSLPNYSSGGSSSAAPASSEASSSSGTRVKSRYDATPSASQAEAYYYAQQKKKNSGTGYWHKTFTTAKKRLTAKR